MENIVNTTADTSVPSWLADGIENLTDGGRESFTLWVLRAITRDVRLAGGRPIVAWPATVPEALWGLEEVPPPPPIDATLAAITVRDLPVAAWQWAHAGLDGPNSLNWRVDVLKALLSKAEKVKARIPLGLGARVYDQCDAMNGVVIEHLPAQAKGWRVYELFVVQLDNGAIVQRSATQLRRER